MKPNAIYLRKSRADDPTEPLQDTLHKHKKLLLDFCKQRKLYVENENVYEEVVSGDSLYARPEMLQLLEKVSEGYYDSVIIVDIQRLGRGSLQDQGIILDAFKRSGTKIITPTRVYDLENETDETYTEFEQFMGRQELKMILRRLNRGKRQTLMEGAYMANAPYGYERCIINKLPSLRIVEKEAEIIRVIFDLYTSQGYGSTRIADTVNSMGAKPHRAAAFGRTSIMTILSNPTYIGQVTWNRQYSDSVRPGKGKRWKRPEEEWTVVDGLHEPIIDKETFEKAQELRKGRGIVPTTTGNKENPLAGLVYCKNCGSLMQRAASTRTDPYLLCLKKGCVVSSKLDSVESAIIDAVGREINRLSIDAQKATDRNHNTHAETIQSIAQTIEQTKKQLSRLQDLLEQDVYDISTYLERKKEIDARLIKLKDQKRQFEEKEQHIDYDATIQQIETVLNLYYQGTPEARNDHLKSIIDRVVYHKEKGAAPNEFTLNITFKPIWVRS